MLRKKILFAAALAAANFPVLPAGAQPQPELSERLERAEHDLDDKIGRCAPIDVKAYSDLYNEADRAFRFYLKATLDKVPTDDIHAVNAKKATDLLKKAEAAARSCATGGSGTKPIEFETKVEPPKLSPVTPPGNTKPSTLTIENKGPDYVFMFRAALARYVAAKKRCDGPGMMAARAEMDAAQGAAREILAGEKVLGGKSELLKQMAEQRQAAEDGTVSMCPSLTPTLAHMLSEPPRVSSEPISEEASKTQSNGVPAYHPPTVTDPALAAHAHAVCSGPALGDFGRLPAVPPAGVIPGLAGTGAAAAHGYGPSVEGPRAGADSERSDEPRFHVGLKYTFDGMSACPTYQDTRVPQPELPKTEVFGRVDLGIIDPDYSPPLQIDLTPRDPK